MGRYQELLKRSWRTGDFKAEPWGTPSMEAASSGEEDGPGLRRRLRGELERIIEGEAERLSQSQETKNREARMKLVKFVKFREEKFGGVLFETRQEKVYTLNPTAAAVVRELVAGSGNVVESLKARYEDKTGRMEAEASAFLADLKAKGLVE